MSTENESEVAGKGPTRMQDATNGVWFPVPKKSAARGYTILSPKSLESPKSHKSAYIGSNASRPSRNLTVFRTRPNLLMSEARRSVSGEGKTLVQKFWSLPKLILVKVKGNRTTNVMRENKMWECVRVGVLHVYFFRGIPELTEDAQCVSKGG